MKPLTLIDKAYLLKKTELFETLDLDELLPIADKLNQAQFEPEKMIFSQGDNALRMYFIAKGSVFLMDEKSEQSFVLEAVDFFGDEAIFSSKPRGYSAISQTETIVLSISRTNLLSIISECPSVAIGLLRVYTATMPMRPRFKV